MSKKLPTTLKEYILPSAREEYINQIKDLINAYVKKYNRCTRLDSKKEIMEIIQKHEQKIEELNKIGK